jgi:WD40 repeat protein
VRLWDAQTGEQLRALEGHSGEVNYVAFSPDGGALASGGDDRAVRLWDAQTGEQLCALEGHSGYVNYVAFSPGGGALASCAGWDLWLWDAHTGEQLRALEGHGYGENCLVGQTDDGSEARFPEVHCAAFSPDGGALASGGADGAVRLWDAQTGEQLSAPRCHGSEVRCVAFSPGGGALASGGDNGAVRLWDAQTGEQLRALEGHSASVRCVAFSPDGGALASGGKDGAVRLWDVETGQLLSCLLVPDKVLRLWWDLALPRLCCVDAGGATHRPRVYVLEFVRP